MQLHPCLSEAAADGLYLRLDASNDPVTDAILISPANDDHAILAKKHIKIKAGQRLILDSR